MKMTVVAKNLRNQGYCEPSREADPIARHERSLRLVGLTSAAYWQSMGMTLIGLVYFPMILQRSGARWQFEVNFEWYQKGFSADSKQGSDLVRANPKPD